MYPSGRFKYYRSIYIYCVNIKIICILKIIIICGIAGENRPSGAKIQKWVIYTML